MSRSNAKAIVSAQVSGIIASPSSRLTALQGENRVANQPPGTTAGLRSRPAGA
jgi:hypothetical protein